MLCSALALVGGLSSGLIVPTAQLRLPSTRAAHVVLCADADAADAKMKEAAARVVSAAAQFGETQGNAAASWVEDAMDAMSGEEMDTAGLMDKQMALFEECVIEDAQMCIELDLALSALEKELTEECPVDAELAGLCGKSKIDRASARVRTAASKFGAEQERIAEMWVAEVRSEKGAVNPFALLEQQFALFGECLLDEDGSSDKCKELEAALGALQVSLGVRGKIMPTGGLNGMLSKPKPN